MYVYDSYYVLGKMEENSYFLTEDKTFTEQLERALKFKTKNDAEMLLKSLEEEETDELYNGDYMVHQQVEIKKVGIIIV